MLLLERVSNEYSMSELSDGTAGGDGSKWQNSTRRRMDRMGDMTENLMTATFPDSVFGGGPYVR